MLITKHAKDLPRLREIADEVGSCYESEELGWTKGYIAGLGHKRYYTNEEMRKQK